jgi:hypothetical protein
LQSTSNIDIQVEIADSKSGFTEHLKTDSGNSYLDVYKNITVKVVIRNDSEETTDVELEEVIAKRDDMYAMGNVKDFIFECFEEAECSGSFAENGKVMINELAAGESVELSYLRDVPAGKTSGKYTLVILADSGDKDSAIMEFSSSAGAGAMITKSTINTTGSVELEVLTPNSDEKAYAGNATVKLPHSYIDSFKQLPIRVDVKNTGNELATVVLSERVMSSAGAPVLGEPRGFEMPCDNSSRCTGSFTENGVVVIEDISVDSEVQFLYFRDIPSNATDSEYVITVVNEDSTKASLEIATE